MVRVGNLLLTLTIFYEIIRDRIFFVASQFYTRPIYSRPQKNAHSITPSNRYILPEASILFWNFRKISI